MLSTRPKMPPYDSFLPSGAVASPPMFSPGSLSSPQIRSAGSDRSSAADYFGLRTSPPGGQQQRPLYSHSTSSQSRRPISPPKTRSASAEEKAASMIEDWRAYTKKIRNQAEGERKHMALDRERIQEVQAEERVLWDTERATLTATIAEQNKMIDELEREVEKLRAAGGLNGTVARGRQRSQARGQAPAIAYTPGSIPVSITGSGSGSSESSVPQESGRDENGAKFYAPTASNPSRTFEDPGSDGLRVNTITLPRESPIRVSSNELSASSFGPQGRPSNGGSATLDKIPETPAENVDISLIHPGLEGIHIKTSAIEATFVATVLSPQGSSPSVLSPEGVPPRPRADGKENRLPLSREVSAAEREKIDTKTLILAPEDRRLTLHAGHTPSHSVINLAGFTTESGTATPTMANTHANQNHIHHNSEATPFDLADDEEEEEEVEQEQDVDKALSGPLALSNEPGKDDFFLNQLSEKLAKVEKDIVEEETREAEEDKASVSGLSATTSPVLGKSVDEILEGEADEPMLPLRMKPSKNFGVPFGRLG